MSAAAQNKDYNQKAHFTLEQDDDGPHKDKGAAALNTHQTRQEVDVLVLDGKTTSEVSENAG